MKILLFAGMFLSAFFIIFIAYITASEFFVEKAADISTLLGYIFFILIISYLFAAALKRLTSYTLNFLDSLIIRVVHGLTIFLSLTIPITIAYNSLASIIPFSFHLYILFFIGFLLLHIWLFTKWDIIIFTRDIHHSEMTLSDDDWYKLYVERKKDYEKHKEAEQEEPQLYLNDGETIIVTYSRIKGVLNLLFQFAILALFGFIMYILVVVDFNLFISLTFGYLVLLGIYRFLIRIFYTTIWLFRRDTVLFRYDQHKLIYNDQTFYFHDMTYFSFGAQPPFSLNLHLKNDEEIRIPTWNLLFTKRLNDHLGVMANCIRRNKRKHSPKK